MRFPGHETVLIENRAHVNAALVKQNHSALFELLSGIFPGIFLLHTENRIFFYEKMKA